MGIEITLVLGGARSGKSEVAERLARGLETSVTYVATGTFEGDPDWDERVRVHRERRPTAWRTIEIAPGADLGGALSDLSGPALVDSLGTWVTGLPEFGADGAQAALLDDALDARRARGHPTILVSEEVGLGVHPSTAAGAHFRDALGRLNRLVADRADSVLLVVAGRVLPLGRDGGG